MHIKKIMFAYKNRSLFWTIKVFQYYFLFYFLLLLQVLWLQTTDVYILLNASQVLQKQSILNEAKCMFLYLLNNRRKKTGR